MGMEQAWLLPAVPAAVFALLALFHRALPRGGDALAILGMLAVAALGLLVVLDFQSAFEGGKFAPGGAHVYAFEWARIGDVLRIEFSTYVDAIAVVMIAVVSVVTLMVMIYSTGYMRGEPRYGWYFALLSGFAAAMLMLVTAGNLLLLYLAWEAVGLASYLLIGFYWERQTAAEAAKKAFVTTRIGDVGLLIGIILLWRGAGSFDIQEIIAFARAGGYGETYLTFTMLFLFAGAAGKSAQFPLHVWLPDAMEGPTPVSALIHAATMVVAGVYLVARMMPVFDEVLVARDVVLYAGLVTAALGATIGLVTSDVKRVLAYSTVSQLGFMFVALGVGSVTAAMFHLFTHAFFKSLLFLGAGSVIHASGEQTVEKLGGLRRRMPLTAAVFAVGSLALAGIVPLAGFWSKDEILAELRGHEALPLFLVLAATSALTAVYATRLVLLTFFGEPKDRAAHGRAHESPPPMLLPMLLLAALSAAAGFVAFEGVGKALGFAGGVGAVVYAQGGHGHVFAVDAGIAAGATAAALAGIVVGCVYWRGRAERAERARAWAPEVHDLLVRRYYLDELYQFAIDRVVLGLATAVAVFDRRVINESGVDGTAQGIGFAGFRLRFLQTGRIPNYALAMAVGAAVLALVALGRT